MINTIPSANDLLAKLDGFYRFAQELRPDTLDWGFRPAEDEWSLAEVMCHLRDVEVDVHQYRLKAILDSENVFLPGQDTDYWAIERDYASQDGPQALAGFLAARQETLALVRGLKPEDWQRTARHSFLGKTTIQELMAIAVSHEEEHWQQVRDLLVQANGRPPGSP